MPRVLLSGKLHPDGMAVLRARDDVTIVEMAGEEPDEFVAKLPDADALLIRTAILPREALVNARRLKVVSRHGVGYDNVPVEALTEKGVPLAVVGGIHSGTVA
jgi:D-3-phosphoglycerate dehydrogenase